MASIHHLTMPATTSTVKRDITTLKMPCLFHHQSTQCLLETTPWDHHIHQWALLLPSKEIMEAQSCKAKTQSPCSALKTSSRNRLKNSKSSSTMMMTTMTTMMINQRNNYPRMTRQFSETRHGGTMVRRTSGTMTLKANTQLIIPIILPCLLQRTLSTATNTHSYASISKMVNSWKT